MKQALHTKTKIISKILLSLGSAFVLVSAITQVHGDSPTIPPPWPPPVINIYSGNVIRGEAGAFILFVSPCQLGGGIYVNFSVGGTAIPGVDYVPLVSPVCIGCGAGPEAWCAGAIPVTTLPRPRPSSFGQDYDVVVTLEPGLGYVVGEPSSAQMNIIEP
jgi:hypothetical protein